MPYYYSFCGGMTEAKEVDNNSSPSPNSSNIAEMQAAQQTMVQQQQTQVQQAQQQAVTPQQAMQQVMPQAPQNSPSPVGASTTMPHQSQQFYVQASIGSPMQVPPAIAPAPMPQTSTNTVSALHHQPLQHHQALQPINHPGVSASPMPQALAGQFSQQVQVIQGAQYLQHVYPNGSGQLIMPIQSAAGMNTQIQPNAINTLTNQPIQVIAAATGKPFQGQLGPHMIAGKPGVLQGGQTGYTQSGIPTSGSQTLVIGPVGVINSSQTPNILPAHSGGPKPGDNMQKQQAVGFQQMAWATPGASLLAPNSPIFIRGTQPAQGNVFIPAQQMPQHNSMMAPVGSVAQSVQNPKQRSNMEMPTNIQPKTANMRPPILPSMTTAQIRPGASVSTQTAGQAIAPAQMGNPRGQGKVRGKNANNRAPQANLGAQQQQAQAQAQAMAQAQAQAQVQQQQQTQQIQQQQILQTAPILTQSMPVGQMSVVGSNTMVLTSGSQTLTPMTQTALVTKSQGITMQAMNQNMAMNQKQGITVTQATAPIAPAGQQQNPGMPQLVRLPNNKQPQMITSTAPMVTTVQGGVQVPIVPATNNVLQNSNPTPPPNVSGAAPVMHQQVTGQPMQSPVHMNGTMPPNSMVQASNVSMNVPIAIQANNQVSITPNQTAEADANTATQPQQQMMQNQIAKPNAKIEPKTESPNKKIDVASTRSFTTGSTTISTNSVAQYTYSTVNGQQPSENGEVQDKPTKPITMNGVNHGSIINTPTGPPKAMVKPHVLTHVIEGYVIHEASEPFPVNRSSLLSEIAKPRSTNVNNSNNINSNHTTNSEEKENQLEDDNKKKDPSGKGDTLTCETCGKTEAASKFKRSKRFCSSSCAKRFNASGGKRPGSFKSTDESPSKKPKEDTHPDATGPQTLSSPSEELELSTNPSYEAMEGEGSLCPSGEESPNMPKVDILNWTVRDVVDFIQNLPGCQDYAGDFELQEIDGQALMLLKADHLMSAMSMKLGPALKICAKIEMMRGTKEA